MTDPDVLRDTVAGLIANFKQSLLALIPSADRSQLGWREYEHPDWELLMAACYQAFVAGPISTDSRRMVGDYQLIRYDIDPEDLSSASWIAPSEHEPNLALVRLRSQASPFDTSEFVEIESRTSVVSSRNILRPSDAEFVLVRRGPGGRHEICANIESSD
jgi:hypothetical protein